MTNPVRRLHDRFTKTRHHTHRVWFYNQTVLKSKQGLLVYSAKVQTTMQQFSDQTDCRTKVLQSNKWRKLREKKSTEIKKIWQSKQEMVKNKSDSQEQAPTLKRSWQQQQQRVLHSSSLSTRTNTSERESHLLLPMQTKNQWYSDHNNTRSYNPS